MPRAVNAATVAISLDFNSKFGREYTSPKEKEVKSALTLINSAVDLVLGNDVPRNVHDRVIVSGHAFFDMMRNNKKNRYNYKD